jgi:pilus assembly protein FimV
MAGGSTYRVRPNDTLYRIASKANPGSRSEVNRAMVSIYQNNPDAFDGNINLLRSGSTLRIPDAGQIQAISAAAAAAEVTRQYDAWRSGTPLAAPAAQQAAAPAESGRLRLVTPDQGSAAPSTSVAGNPAGTTPTVAAASAATQAPTQAPTPAVTPAETPPVAGSIEDRVRQLEAELTEARRLLEVRNAELATLQGGTPDGTADAAAGPATPSVGSQATQPQPEAMGPTLLERAQEYWWVLLGLLGAALGVLLFRRVRRERGAAEESLEEALGTARDLRASKFNPRPRDSDILVEEKRAVEPVARATSAGSVVSTPRATERARPPASVEDTYSGEAPSSTESSDPLAEADFHMAYGLYDQAADLVQLAIKREPQRHDLRLKLLEIYFVWGNRDRFVELAREFDASRSEAPAGEWDKVLIMGKQIAPDEPLFAGSPSADPDMLDLELHGTASTLDLDLDISGLSGTTSDVEPAVRPPGGTGLDFILDEPIAEAGESLVAPTIETPRFVRGGQTTSDTQELTVDDLGLDLDALRELEALESDDTVSTPKPSRVDDTVETPRAASTFGNFIVDEPDLLNATALMDSLDESIESIELIEPDVVDLSDSTGHMPSLDDDLSATSLHRRFDGGESPTMSEVGTKLDLARAYMDMGDPEGARSILDEVLQEGNAGQKQEAQRLVASLR